MLLLEYVFALYAYHTIYMGKSDPLFGKHDYVYDDDYGKFFRNE